MKYKVVISSLFIDGVKYRRGDVVELDSNDSYGVKLSPVFEPEPEKELVEVKPKRRRVKKSEA